MIILRLKGGLGNQMFQYALGRVLSIKNKTELVFNIEAYEDVSERPFKGNFAIRTYDLDVFNIEGRIAKKNEIPFLYRMYFKGSLMLLIDAIRRRIFKHKAQELCIQKFNPKMLGSGPDTYVDGFFQSPKYFIGFEDVIKKDFTLKNPPSFNIQNLANEIGNTNSLCIHVRRGDYVGNKYHEVVDNEYYKKGIEYISSKTVIEKIHVFSDDIDWCRENLAFKIPAMFVDDGYAGSKGEGHMFLMSQCHYFIIANSSFSWWGAWLSNYENKIVVCPKQWFTDASIDTNDLMPKDWIRM